MKKIFASIILPLCWGVACAGAAGPPNDDPVFVPYAGGADPSARFQARRGSLLAEFGDHSISMGTTRSGVRIQFVGAEGRSNLRREGDTLLYRDTWPGIDTQIAPYQKTLKSEYHVAPGADPRLIRLRYDGDYPTVLGNGSLVVGLRGAAFVESPPYAYQGYNDRSDGRTQVEVAYRIYRDGSVGFTLGSYDPSRPLVIDPVMNYSTLFGGSGDTSVTAVAFDTFGNAVVAGWTTAADLPAHGARTKSGGGVDAFVAKLSAQGNQIVWCTYLGGSGDDRVFGIAVDAANNVYVTGWTTSSNFPVFAAIQPKSAGGRDAFVTKLNASGTAIVYSTYLGGSNYDQGNAIAVDSTGAAYVAGDTLSANFPVLNAYQTAYGGGQQDAFVAKLNPAGSALVFSTYLGGNAADHGAAIALDAWRNVYVAGSTYSSNFPLVSASQPKIAGGQDAFAAELGPGGNVLLFSTYIGGSGGTPGLGECANAVAVDGSGNLYVAGSTSSIDFPTTPGAYQRTLTNGGAEDHGFAWKINSAKTQILYSTYLAGMNLDTISGMALDPAGNAYLVGATSSTDFPGVRAFQPAITGLTNAFLLKLNPTGSGLIFGSFLGGSSTDTANSVAVDAKQNIVIGGLSQSPDFPLRNAAQSYSNGPFSGFVTRVVSGWYPITFQNGIWSQDIWHDAGYDGSSWTPSVAAFGQTGDLPVVGDWNKSGATNIGVFRNGLWILDSNGNGRIDATDRQFTFGQAGDVPLVGDWDGTGFLKAGLFRHGIFILDLSGHMSGVSTGKQDANFYFGLPTDVPVAGDWGSTGATKVGVFRNGTWYLDVNNDHQWDAGDRYLVYGITGDTPIVGDWDGSGTVKVGVVRGGFWMLNISGSNQFVSNVDTQFWYGNSAFTFLAGH